MRVPKMIWKHNLLIHSSSSRAGDPVQWSNFPQQQDALHKKIFNHMINIVLLLTMKISFLFFIISHPNPWTTVLVSTFETILSWRNRIFLCEKEIQMSVLHVRLVCSFICFDVVSPFTVVPPSLTQRKMGGGGSFYATQETGGLKLKYDFLRSSLRWEWWPWQPEQCVFVANIWLNKGFL